MIKLRPYEKGDSYKVDAMEVFQPIDLLKELVDKQGQASYAHTVYLEESGEVIAILGVAQLWPGVCEVWTLLSKSMAKFKFTVTKLCLAIMAHYKKEINVIRYQAVVKLGYVAGEQWIHFLGFSPEGILRKYGTEGADYMMWSKV